MTTKKLLVKITTLLISAFVVTIFAPLALTSATSYKNSPDLEIIPGTITYTPDNKIEPRENISFYLKIKNSGTKYYDGDYYEFFLKLIDAETGHVYYKTKPFNKIIIGPGAAVNVGFAFPGFEKPGDKKVYIRLETNFKGEYTANNSSKKFTIKVDKNDDTPQPETKFDLKVKNFSYSPAQPKVNEQVKFNITVQNIGSETFDDTLTVKLISNDTGSVLAVESQKIKIKPNEAKEITLKRAFIEPCLKNLYIKLETKKENENTDNNKTEIFTLKVSSSGSPIPPPPNPPPSQKLDLSVKNYNFTPEKPFINEEVKFEVKIQNNGEKTFDDTLTLNLINAETGNVLNFRSEPLKLKPNETATIFVKKKFETEGEKKVYLQIDSKCLQDDKNNKTQTFTITIKNKDTSGSTRLVDQIFTQCDIVGYGTFYGFKNNERSQLGISRKESHEPCYVGMKLNDFIWTVNDESLAEIDEYGVITTFDRSGDLEIKAKNKNTGEVIIREIPVGDDRIINSLDGLSAILEDRIPRYGKSITVLLDYIIYVPDDQQIKMLRHKAKTLQAVENIYIHINRLRVKNDFSKEFLDRLKDASDLIEMINYIDEPKDAIIEVMNQFAIEIDSDYIFDNNYWTEDLDGENNEYDTSEIYFTDAVEASYIEDENNNVNEYDDSYYTDDDLFYLINNLKSKAEDNAAYANTLKFNLDIIPFIDTPDHEWYAGYIYFNKLNGIVSGYEDAEGNLLGEYRPANSVSVNEIIKIALETSGIEIESGIPENELAFDTWANDYYYTAELLELSIVEDPFDEPVRPATRQEVIRTVLEANGIDPEDISSTSFEDVSEDSEYAKWIEYAFEAGIISGDDYSNTFRPEDEINRAETAKIAQLAKEIL